MVHLWFAVGAPHVHLRLTSGTLGYIAACLGCTFGARVIHLLLARRSLAVLLGSPRVYAGALVV